MFQMLFFNLSFSLRCESRLQLFQSASQSLMKSTKGPNHQHTLCVPLSLIRVHWGRGGRLFGPFLFESHFSYHLSDISPRLPSPCCWKIWYLLRFWISFHGCNTSPVLCVRLRRARYPPLYEPASKTIFLPTKELQQKELGTPHFYKLTNNAPSPYTCC